MTERSSQHDLNFCEVELEVFGILDSVPELFRIESERLKLPAPFSQWIAESLDADAAGQATFYGSLDKIRREEGE